MIAHVCHGQFFYIDYQDSKYWLETHQGELSDTSIINSDWQGYLTQKNVIHKKERHLGAFIHYKNNFKQNSIYQKSDLIGNGLLTNYRHKHPNVEIVNSMFFTHDSLEAERGFVRTIKNVTMYTNQAFIKINNVSDGIVYSAKIGRDFLRIGHGINTSLFVSDYSRPFDQFTVRAQTGKLNGLFSIIALDTLEGYNRYLYLHTLNYKSNKLSLTIGEGVLDTGIGKSISLNYANPIHLWTWENISGGSQGINGFLYAGFTWLPVKELRVYGEFLIDDINFHKKDAFYLNRYGLLGGMQKTGFPLKSSNIWIEYSNVLHQVYQSYHPTHTYIHRNFPVGHYLGNDFINVRIHYSHLMKSGRIKPIIDISYLMDGSNGLETPFDNPWETYEGLVADYVPPSHPTPPVTTWIESEVGAEINIGSASYITITAQYQVKSIKNEESSEFGLGIRFWSYLQSPFKNK